MPEVVVDGEVLEVDPPHRLVQTWRLNFDPPGRAEGFTTVTWEIRPEGDNLSRLTVTHDVTDAPVMADTIGPTARSARAAAVGPSSSVTSRPCWRPARPNEL